MIGNVWEWTETRHGKGAPRFTMKGGSYLCSEDYCRRYRPAARQGFEPELGFDQVGFRVVRDVGEMEP
jgi:formylglycine-generating enzyme